MKFPWFKKKATKLNDENCDHCHVCIRNNINDKQLKLEDQPFHYFMMILCPSCGNKRCPKATYHRNSCTHSNDSGQPGSIYQ